MRLKDLKVDDYLNCSTTIKFIVIDIAQKISRDGNKPYLNLTIKDNNRVITASYFKELKHTDSIDYGVVYEGGISVSDYKGEPSVILNYLTELEEDVKEYMHWIPNYNTYLEMYETAITQLGNSRYGLVAREIYKKYKDRFIVVPSGTRIHHTEFGGNLFHTVTIALGGMKLADLYNNAYGKNFIDKKLLLCSALLHDVCKAMEIQCNPETGEIKYSEDSIYETHITQVLKEVDRIAVKYSIETTEEIKNLSHCLMSHHGDLESGSPKKPMLPEAIILHMMDSLDSRMWAVNNTFKDLECGQHKSIRIGDGYSTIYKATNK